MNSIDKRFALVSTATSGGGLTLGTFTSMSGTGSTCIGTNAAITGNNAVALGNFAKSIGNKSIAIGNAKVGTDLGGGTFTGSNSIAIGTADIVWDDCISIGTNFDIGQGSIAIGNLVTSYSSPNCINVGYNSRSLGDEGIAIGLNSSTSAYNCVSIGSNSVTTGVRSIALGTSVSGVHQETIAIGYNTISSGQYGIAIGDTVSVTATHGLALGNLSRANFNNSTSLGYGAVSTDTNQITLGDSSIASLRCQQTTITGLSDRRDKTDINPISLGLDVIKDIKPVQFKWDMRSWYENGVVDGTKTADKYTAGFIAQDFDEIQTKYNCEWLKLVDKSDNNKWEATPGNLLPVLVRAIQEQQEMIELLKQEIDILNTKG